MRIKHSLHTSSSIITTQCIQTQKINMHISCVLRLAVQDLHHKRLPVSQSNLLTDRISKSGNAIASVKPILAFELTDL